MFNLLDFISILFHSILLVLTLSLSSIPYDFVYFILFYCIPYQDTFFLFLHFFTLHHFFSPAAAGWPLSELWHKEIANVIGLDSILVGKYVQYVHKYVMCILSSILLSHLSFVLTLILFLLSSFLCYLFFHTFFHFFFLSKKHNLLSTFFFSAPLFAVTNTHSLSLTYTHTRQLTVLRQCWMED